MQCISWLRHQATVIVGSGEGWRESSKRQCTSVLVLACLQQKQLLLLLLLLLLPSTSSTSSSTSSYLVGGGTLGGALAVKATRICVSKWGCASASCVVWSITLPSIVNPILFSSLVCVCMQSCYIIIYIGGGTPLHFFLHTTSGVFINKLLKCMACFYLWCRLAWI